jgi:hypothetical protein
MPNPMHAPAPSSRLLQPPQNRMQSGTAWPFWVLTPGPNRAIKRNRRRTGNSQLVHAASRADPRLGGCSRVTIVRTGLTAAPIHASIPALAVRTPRPVLVTVAWPQVVPTPGGDHVPPPGGDRSPPRLRTARGARWCRQVGTRAAAGLTLAIRHAMLKHVPSGRCAVATSGNGAPSTPRACWPAAGG